MHSRVRAPLRPRETFSRVMATGRSGNQVHCCASGAIGAFRDKRINKTLDKSALTSRGFESPAETVLTENSGDLEVLARV